LLPKGHPKSNKKWNYQAIQVQKVEEGVAFVKIN
jgi:hypothetical protein